MDGYCGFKFNRFGGEIEEASIDYTKVTTEMQQEQFNAFFAEKVTELQNEFQAKVQEIFDVVKVELSKEQASIVSDVKTLKDHFTFGRSYFSVRNRRLVSVMPAIDRNDCVIKSQLDAVESVIIRRLQTLEEGQRNQALGKP